MLIYVIDQFWVNFLLWSNKGLTLFFCMHLYTFPITFCWGDYSFPTHFFLIHTFIYFSISLNPRRVQHHNDSVSNGLNRKVASEFGTNHAIVSMNVSYLFSDYSGFVKFSTRSFCVVLCFMHISTSLAWIEISFILSTYTFDFQESCVVPLVL